MRKKLALLLALVLVCSIVFTACGNKLSEGNNGPGSPNETGSPDGTGNTGTDSKKKTEMLVVHVGSDPDTIDPALNSAVDGATLIIHAFEGLMTLDKDGVPVKAQAKDYTVSEDGTTYTFYLRDDIKWSDGSRLPRMTTFTHGTVRSIRTQRPTMSTCSMLSKVMTRKH